MNVCNKCGYKVISKAIFERHLQTHVVDVVDVPVVSETQVESVVEAVPEHREDPIKPISDEITLRFTKPIEVYINGRAYLGTEIVVKDMSTAAEIVRITREAYGPTILA